MNINIRGFGAVSLWGITSLIMIMSLLSTSTLPNTCRLELIIKDIKQKKKKLSTIRRTDSITVESRGRGQRF